MNSIWLTYKAHYFPTSKRPCTAMLAGSLLLITRFDISLGTPGAGVCLPPSCWNQPETGNTAFWGEGSSGMCDQLPSGKQQAEAVVFSFSTAQTTTDMWQTYVHPSCNDFSACSGSASLAQQTQAARNQKIRIPDLANGKHSPRLQQ